MKTLFVPSKIDDPALAIACTCSEAEFGTIHGGVFKSIKDEIVKIYELNSHRFDTFVIVNNIGSTNEFLNSVATELPDGVTVIARNQTSGRGRRTRSWLSQPDSSLIMSTLIKGVKWETLRWINYAMSVAICDIIYSEFGANVRIKWPNDVVYPAIVENRPRESSSRETGSVLYKKLCGILSESSLNPNQEIDYVVVGVGLNILRMEFDLPEATGQIDGVKIGNTLRDDDIATDAVDYNLRFLNPVSVEEILDREFLHANSLQTGLAYDKNLDFVDVPLFAHSILETFNSYLKLIDLEGTRGFLEIYSGLSATLNSYVNIYTDDGKVVSGVAQKISTAGELIVRAESGDICISAGDVVHLRQPR